MNFNSLLELTDKSNNEFYPTPKPIVSKMLNDVDLYNFNTILEPSAGKGDILREIAKCGKSGCRLPTARKSIPICRKKKKKSLTVFREKKRITKS